VRTRPARSRSHPPDAASAPDDEPASLTVHVTGAVADPGLVVVDDGARVADAIELAGGAADDAELHRLNLARPLHDGEQVHVPRDGEDLPAGATGDATGGAGGPIDINRADAATLETLPGIGPARAQAIIEHRETHGPFAEPGDLREVPGIGEATFQRLADDVTTS
jgi:competence protein ComEA